MKVPIFLVRWSYFLCDGHISCAMVAEGILSPFSVGCSLFILSNVFISFYQLFPFSSISCFSPSSGASLFFPLDISLFLL